MKIKWSWIICIPVIFMYMTVFAEDDTGRRLSGALMKALEDGHWQVTADEVYMWLKTNRTDFLVIDVRPDAEEYNAGHIPGAIHIPYFEVLKPENLKNLPKDKKTVLVCATGQLQNIPVLALRLLRYDAYTMLFGYTAWIKDYAGGEAMRSIINKASAKKYPLEQKGGTK